MTAAQDTGVRSPWFSIWLSPRQTIDHILASNPRGLVWLLAAIGAIASFYLQFLSLGFLDQLLGWRGWLGLIASGVVLGILFLYIHALILRWIGGLIGGCASSLELRAVLAWSAIPGIAGLVIALSLNAAANALGPEAISPAMISLLSSTIAVLLGLWSLVALLTMLSRVQGFGFWRTIVNYGAILVLQALIALSIRTFLFQPFSLPSRSMEPTLLVGDNFLVSKYAYGYTHYSFPFSPPLFAGRIFGAEPARGDVVVFRSSKGVMTDFVKRVVGLPGDRIQMRQGVLYVNDAAVRREPLEYFVGDACGTEVDAKVKHWREILPNGKAYETLDCVERGFYDDTNIYAVPPGHFFVLGDNRDNSTDSRVMSAIGYVPFENMIGRVELVHFSRAPREAGVQSTVRPGRTGLLIR